MGFLMASICPFIHSFHQQTFLKQLPCDNHCARHQKHNVKQDRHVFLQFGRNGMSYSTQLLTYKPPFSPLLLGQVVCMCFTPHFLFVKLSRKFGQSALRNSLKDQEETWSKIFQQFLTPKLGL